jgi:hypothetical protein
MRKRTDCRESLCTTHFSFSFLLLLGIDELRTGVLGWGVFVSLSFLSLRLLRLEFWFDWIESWVVARSFRYSFCLFFFLFSLLEKKLHHHSILCAYTNPKKTSSLILIVGLSLTLVW